MALQRRLAQSHTEYVPLPSPLAPRATVRGNVGEIMARLRPGGTTRIEVAMSKAPEPRDKLSLLVGAFVVLMLCDVVKEVAKEMIQREGTVEEALKDPSVTAALSNFLHSQVVPHIEKGIFRKEAERVGVMSAALQMQRDHNVRQCSQKLHWSFSAGPMVGLFSLNTGMYQGLDILPFSLWNSRRVATASTEFEYRRSDDTKKTVRLIAFFRNDFGYYSLLALAAYDETEPQSPMRIFHFQGGYAAYLQQLSRERYYDAACQLEKACASAPSPSWKDDVEASFEEMQAQSDKLGWLKKRTEELKESRRDLEVAKEGMKETKQRVAECTLTLQKLGQKLGDDLDASRIRKVAMQHKALCHPPYRVIKDTAFAVKNPAVLLRSSRDQNWMGVLQKGQLLACAIRFPRGRNLVTNGKVTTQFAWSEEKFANHSYFIKEPVGSVLSSFGEHSQAKEPKVAASGSDGKMKKVKVIHKKQDPSQRRSKTADESHPSDSEAT